MDIARTVAEGGKEVVGALDKRIGDVTSVINVRGAKLAESIGAKIEDIDKALGIKAMEVADNLIRASPIRGASDRRAES